MNPAAAARGKIIARAWRDPEFKARLVADPKTVCRENGLDLPDEMNLAVLEQAAKKEMVFVLPAEGPPLEELKKMNHAEVHERFDERMGYGFGCCGFDFPRSFRAKSDGADLAKVEQLAQSVSE